MKRASCWPLSVSFTADTVNDDVAVLASGDTQGVLAPVIASEEMV